MTVEADISKLLRQAEQFEVKAEEGQDSRRNYQRAATAYEKATGLSVKHLGRDNEKTLAIRDLWAICLREAGDVSTAILCNRENVERYTMSKGSQDSLTLDAQRRLAENYLKNSQFAEAIKNYEAVVFASKAARTVRTLCLDRSDLAAALFQTDEKKNVLRAKDLNIITLQKAEQGLGKDDIDTVKVRYNLAGELYKLNQYNDALFQFRENLNVLNQKNCKARSDSEYSAYVADTEASLKTCEAKIAWVKQKELEFRKKQEKEKAEKQRQAEEQKRQEEAKQKQIAALAKLAKEKRDQEKREKEKADQQRREKEEQEKLKKQSADQKGGGGAEKQHEKPATQHQRQDPKKSKIDNEIEAKRKAEQQNKGKESQAKADTERKTRETPVQDRAQEADRGVRTAGEGREGRPKVRQDRERKEEERKKQEQAGQKKIVDIRQKEKQEKLVKEREERTGHRSATPRPSENIIKTEKGNPKQRDEKLKEKTRRASFGEYSQQQNLTPEREHRRNRSTHSVAPPQLDARQRSGHSSSQPKASSENTPIDIDAFQTATSFGVDTNFQGSTSPKIPTNTAPATSSTTNLSDAAQSRTQSEVGTKKTTATEQSRPQSTPADSNKATSEQLRADSVLSPGSSKVVQPVPVIKTEVASTATYRDIFVPGGWQRDFDEPSSERKVRKVHSNENLGESGLRKLDAGNTKQRRASSIEPPRVPRISPAGFSPNLSYSKHEADKADEWFYDLDRFVHSFLDKYKDDLHPPNKNKASRKVKIAILDTGIAKRAPTPERIRSNISRIKFGKTLDKSLPPFEDTNGHGTHAAGLILQVCPYADLYVYRVLEGHESIKKKYVTEALDDAIEKKRVDIVSMSFGWDEDSDPELRAVIERAKMSNVLIFAASSNEGIRTRGGMAYPARALEVIAVDAADGLGNPSKFNPPQKRDKARFTTLGEAVESSFPIQLARRGEEEGLRRMSGTSCATPIAAGIAGLVLEFARQRPLCFDPSIETHLKSVVGMRQIFTELLSLKFAENSQFNHLDPIKLFHTTQGFEDGGEWYQYLSPRLNAANAIIQCLRREFSYDIGSVVSLEIEDEVRRAVPAQMM